jgi:hypothetical protein
MDADLDRRLAILAGWEYLPIRSSHGTGPWLSPKHEGTEYRSRHQQPPAYTTSIDAQRELDVLVEEKWGKFGESVRYSRVRAQYWVTLGTGWVRWGKSGCGPTRAHARAAALEAALGETPNVQA